MTIHVEVRPHQAGGSVHVSVFDVGEKFGSKVQLRMDTNGHIWCWEPVVPNERNVSFTLTDEAIPKVIEALLAWMVKRDGGKVEPLNMTSTGSGAIDFHAEYMAERERADKLLDVVVALSQN